MARSHAIWVVTCETEEFLHVMACFTVKHELVTWLEQRTRIYEHELDTLEISKHIDGPRTTADLENVIEFGTAREFLESVD